MELWEKKAWNSKKSEIINDISLLLRLDKRVIKMVVDYPFLFITRKMKDIDDERSFMVHYFGKFIFRKGKSKKDPNRKPVMFDAEKREFINKV